MTKKDRKGERLAFRADADLLDRIKGLLVIAQADPMARYFTPTISSVVKAALRRGIDDLEEEWGNDD